MADARGGGGEKAGPEPRLYVVVASPESLPPRLRGVAEPVRPEDACRVTEGIVVVPRGATLPCTMRALVVEGPASPEALADYVEAYGPPGAGIVPPWLDRSATLRLAWTISKSVPRGPWPKGRPPPVLVYSEYYASQGVGEAWRRLAEGADAVVVGGRDAGEAAEALRQASLLARRGIPVGFDYWDADMQAEAALAGVGLVLSVTGETMGDVGARARGRAWFVLVPSNPRASWEERVEDLCESLAKARRLGFEKVILDPVLNPPINPGALEGLLAARELGWRCPRDVPLMLGINNFYELTDVDSHGVIGALVFLAAEAGVEVVLAGEESWKARGATLEARVAAEMAGLALRWRSPPKDLGFNLLFLKEKRPSGSW